MKKKLVSGIVLVTGLLLIAVLGVFRFGFVPVNADVPPSSLEARLIPPILRASVAKRAAAEKSPSAATDETLASGAEIYADMCARCHGSPGKAPLFGQSEAQFLQLPR